MLSNHGLIARFVVLLLACFLPGTAAGAVTLELKPGMPRITPVGVPMLYASLPDADRVEPNVSMQPAEAYRWVFAPGQTPVLQVAAKAEAKADRAVLTIWDWHRDPVEQLKRGVPFEETVQFQVEGRGTYLLTLDAFSGDECTSRLVRSFSVCPSNIERRKLWLKDRFFVGTCSFPTRQHWTNDFGPANPPGLSEQESRDLDAELSARLGLQVVRPALYVSWGGEDQPMDFDLCDASLDCWTSRGFTLDLQIGQPGDWALKPQYGDVTDPKWRYPKRESAVRGWYSEIARRYAKHAEFIELYNEPDNRDFWRGTPEEYLDYTRWAIDEIRRCAPDAKITNGGYTLIEPEWTGMFARSLQGQTNLVAYHSHGDVVALEQQRRAMVAIHAASGYFSPTFVNTEMGYAAWRLDVERHQAATAIQKTLFCWAHGDRGVFLFCSRGIGGPRLPSGDTDWGHIDYFMCPRFMYGAVAAFVDWYAGAQFVGILSATSQLHAYEFRRGDQRLVAAFTPGDTTRKLTLSSDAEKAVVVDPMGNASPAAQASRVEVTAGLYPVTVVFETATEVALIDG